MAATVFTISEKLDIQGHGLLDEAESMLKSPDLAQAIRFSMKIFRSIREGYLEALGGDGRILGGERTGLIRIADLLFDGIVLMWKYLGGGTMVIVEDDRRFRCTLREQNGRWVLQGQISPEMVDEGYDFLELFQNRLQPEIVEFLEGYKESCADGRIVEEERRDLENRLKGIVYSVLFLRIQLERCLVDS